MNELLTNGRAFNNQPAHFEDCSETYKTIPLSVSVLNQFIVLILSRIFVYKPC